MDMITRIEIEDGIKAAGKLTARVKAVAQKVGKLRGEFMLDSTPEQPMWHMDSFVINKHKPREGMEHLVELEVRTNWSAAISDEDDKDDRVTRIIQFPTWYLEKDGWEEREQRKARNHKRWLAQRNLKGMKGAIDDAEKRVDELKQKYRAMVFLAAESDEAVDP